jgi:hypothetical protein
MVFKGTEKSDHLDHINIVAEATYVTNLNHLSGGEYNHLGQWYHGSSQV